MAAISSFVAGTLSLVGLTFFAPICAGFALAFGPPEYFALMLMGLSLVISLSGRALLKGVISMALGLLAALIGQNPLTGAARLTFGSVDLMAGINFISVIVGVFAISEVMLNIEAVGRSHQPGGDQQPHAHVGRYQALHRPDAPLDGRGVLPGAPARLRAFGDDLRGLRPREADRQGSRSVRQGGHRGRGRARRGQQRHVHRRFRAALLLRAADRALDGRASGRA